MTFSSSGSPHINNLCIGLDCLRSFQNLVFIPIRIRKGFGQDSVSCTPLPVALQSGEVAIQETNHVSSLSLTNSSQTAVFGLAGTYLRGGGQDRTLPISMVISANTTGEVPVRCVEHSRWNGSFGQSFVSSPSDSLVGSQVCFGSSTITQDQVWNTVADLSRSSGTRSSTECHGDMIAQSRGLLNEYTNAITAGEFPDQTVGGLFLVYLGNGRLHCALDVFGTKELFHFYFSRLCESVALTALAGRTSNGSNDYRPGAPLESLWRVVLHNHFAAQLSYERVPLNAGKLLVKTGGKSGCKVAVLQYQDSVLHEMFRWDARCAV